MSLNFIQRSKICLCSKQYCSALGFIKSACTISSTHTSRSGINFLCQHIAQRRLATDSSVIASSHDVARADKHKRSVGRLRQGSGGGSPSRFGKQEHTQKEEYRPREQWQVQKKALKEKFAGTTWAPRKKLSPDALEGIKDLHQQDPERYSTATLSEQFKVSPEAIRRILKSKWVPDDAERADRSRRWEKRGETIWSQMAELGVKPPKKWRQKGIKDPRHASKSSNHLATSLATQASSSKHWKEVKPPISNRIL